MHDKKAQTSPLMLFHHHVRYVNTSALQKLSQMHFASLTECKTPWKVSWSLGNLQLVE